MSMFNTEFTKGVKQYQQAVDKGEAELMEMGFPAAQRPRTIEGELAERPTLPMHMSNLSMAELQDLLAYFTAWHTYAIEQIPRVRSERNTASEAKDFTWAKVRQSKEGTVEDKNDEARQDARYIDANCHYETCDFKYNMIKAILDGLTREIDTISRAITALDNRNHVEGRHVSGEQRGYRNFSGPSMDVMAKFRAKKR